MKYLLVFYFAGFFLADAGVIEKYKLFLKTENDKFQGKVILTLSDSNNGDYIELDQYNYNVTHCTYNGKDPSTTEKSTTPSTTEKSTNPSTTEKSTNPSTTEKSTTPSTKNRQPSTSPKNQTCTFENNRTIKFYGERTDNEVVLEFSGKYQRNGLSMHTINTKERLYVANMTAEDHEIIFPSIKEEEAEFEFGGDGEVMSNLESLRGKDQGEKISLGDLVFITGDIVKDDPPVSPLALYRMKSSEKMGQKLKNIMERVAKLDVSLKILFLPSEPEIHITPQDLIILSKVDLKPDDSGSDYSHIVRTLMDKLFQRREPEERRTFFDIVGPKFASMKVSGISRFPDEGIPKFHAFEEDGFNNSRSLNELASQDQSERENTLLHVKGISVLHLLDSMCGDEKFMKGLSNFIKDGRSKVDEAFEGCFGNKDEAKQFFESWTNGSGYPVVHVISNKIAQYELDQERFLWFGREDKNRSWIIPIDYKTKNGSEEKITLYANKTAQVKINSTYIILDHTDKGFYRVNYDAKVWEALISQLKSNHTVINPVNRMKLIDDVFSFPKSVYNFGRNISDYVTALKLSEYLKDETDPRTLYVAFGALGFLDSALNSSYHEKFKGHMRGILNGLYNKTIKEEVRDEWIQTQIIQLACKFGVEECIKNATATFDEIPSNATELSVKQKLAICSVVRNNSTKWIDSLVLLNTADVGTQEKVSLLACSRDKAILSQFLTQFITQKNEDVFTFAVFNAMKLNPDNIKVILDIIKHFEGAIKKTFGEKCLQKIVAAALPKLNSESAVTVKEIAKNFGQPFREEVNRACDNVKLWSDTKAKRVGDYFKKSGGSQAKPFALVLLVATLLPFANHIFHN